MDNKKKYYLYGLYCPYSYKLRYVGITTGQLSTRLSGHLRNPTNGKIALWFKELSKKNVKPYIKLIREYFTYDELLKGEIDEIKKSRNFEPNILNISDGGDINPMFGKTHTVEAREKISLNNKGLKRTDKQKLERKELLSKLWSDEEWSEKIRLKMSKNMLGNKKALGLKHSKETKAFLSKIHKGNTHSLGYKHSDETKKLMSINNSGENNPMYVKPLSKETLIARSKKVKKNGTYRGEKNGNFKYKIEKTDLYTLFIKENKTIKEIAKQYGCSTTVINDNLRLFNINKPKSNKYNLNLDNINTFLKNGFSLVEIGFFYGCSNKTIHKFIKNHG